MIARILACALVALALASSPARAQETFSDVAAADLVEVLSAANSALDAQSAFNRARQANDTEAAKDAAALLLVSTGEAAFWSTILQQHVTAENTSDQMVADVAELRDLSVRAFDRVTPAVIDGDMGALEGVLDESADTLNALSAVLRRMAQRMAAR